MKIMLEARAKREDCPKLDSQQLWGNISLGHLSMTG